VTKFVRDNIRDNIQAFQSSVGTVADVLSAPETVAPLCYALPFWMVAELISHRVSKLIRFSQIAAITFESSSPTLDSPRWW